MAEFPPQAAVPPSDAQQKPSLESVTVFDASTAVATETVAGKQGWFARLARNPARDWAILFLAIQCLVNVEGYTNAYSRWASLAAMVEDHSLHIDRYYQHTIDWARTPHGHYYSNKAPGPALLGYPLFWYMDRVSTRSAETREQRDKKRVEHRSTVLHVLSVATQAIPYAVVVLLLISALQQLGFSVPALHLAALALLFGNTASLFMNTYFGHGMAATFVLAMLLALHRKRPWLVGLFFGLAVLCDYGTALLLLPLLGAMASLRMLGGVRRLVRFVLGGLLPAAAFAAYHTLCFGGPFALPNKFQNPAFVDVGRDVPNLWGILHLIPQRQVFFDLLFSTERGLLYTQPWMLLSIVLMPFLLWRRSGWAPLQRSFARWTCGFGVLALILLLLMNACFGSWHGGATPGPRYLAVTLPALGLAMTALFARASEFWRQALVVAVMVSLFPFILLYSTCDIMAQPDSPLLPFYLQQLFSAQGRNLQRALFIALGFGWAGWRAIRSIRKSANPAHAQSPTS
jgi:hypothetical protein